MLLFTNIDWLSFVKNLKINDFCKMFRIWNLSWIRVIEIPTRVLRSWKKIQCVFLQYFRYSWCIFLRETAIFILLQVSFFPIFREFNFISNFYTYSMYMYLYFLRIFWEISSKQDVSLYNFVKATFCGSISRDKKASSSKAIQKRKVTFRQKSKWVCRSY